MNNYRSKMHVVLLSNECPPFIFGGIGTFVENFAKGLSRIGVKVTIISGYPVSNISRTTYTRHGNFFPNTENPVRIVRFPYPNLPPRHTMFQIANLKQLCKTITEIDPDIIHGQSSSTFPLSSVLRGLAPIVVTFHTSPQAEKIMSTSALLRGGSLTDFITYLLGYPASHYTFKKELQHSDMAVTVSAALKSEIMTEMGKRYAHKMAFIHNGVDLQSLDREYTEAGNTSESEKTILFAGRLYWRKGALNIIRMAYLLQKKKANFRIIVHGTGPLLNKMRQYISSLKLQNIELKGFVARSQLMRSLKTCRFVAIPSLYEACPMILLESMCLGKIPLMLKLPFSSELTRDGEFGILGEGIKNLTDRLLGLEEGYLSQLSNNVRCFARKEYNINRTLDKYMDIFANLTSS